MSSSTSHGASPGTALITGGTSGIGLEFARQLAARGHDLVLVARDAERLGAVAAELGPTYGVAVESLPADLADRAELDGVAARVASTAAPVTVLVNNAGFGLRHKFADNDLDSEQRMLDVLVTAVLRLSHAALGAMLARGEGRIVNVSSVAGFLPRGTYSAHKAWVNSFSEWAAREYRPRGVHVMALCPGFTRTEFHGRMGVGRDSAPDFLWLDPEFLVARALRDLERGVAVSVPGAPYRMVAAASGLVPGSVLQRFQGLGRR